MSQSVENVYVHHIFMFFQFMSIEPHSGASYTTKSIVYSGMDSTKIALFFNHHTLMYVYLLIY